MHDCLDAVWNYRTATKAIIDHVEASAHFTVETLASEIARIKFGYYLDDHHGDGIVGVAFKAGPGEQQALTRANPERFYVPAYVGSKGWVGLRLDLADIDWTEVRELLTEAYRLQAPKRLAAQLDTV